MLAKHAIGRQLNLKANNINPFELQIAIIDNNSIQIAYKCRCNSSDNYNRSYSKLQLTFASKISRMFLQSDFLSHSQRPLDGSVKKVKRSRRCSWLTSKVKPSGMILSDSSYSSYNYFHKQSVNVFWEWRDFVYNWLQFGSNNTISSPF